MKKLNLKEIQEKELEILCCFDKICRENNIRYGLIGGTLLGAVRHGGFIPWDDDIDVEMPRPDYNKLMRIAEKCFPPHFKMVHPYNDTDTIHAYAKIYDLNTTMIEFPESKKIKGHLYIDVFPVDGMPSDVIAQEKHRKKVRRRMLTLYGFKVAKYKKNQKMSLLKKLFWNLIGMVNYLLPSKFLIKRVDKLAQKYDFDKSKYAGLIVAGYGSREIMPSMVYNFNDNISFCGKSFSSTSKADYYLTSIYGDYMKLPPENERIHHEMEVYMND